jgi:hypothetical protein
MDACLGGYNRERCDGSYRFGASDGRNVQPVHNESAAHLNIFGHEMPRGILL